MISGTCERAGDLSGELKALPISEAVSVLSLLGVGEGWQAGVMLMPPVRPSVRTFRAEEPGIAVVAMVSFLSAFLSLSASMFRASWPSTPETPPPPPPALLRATPRPRTPAFLRNLLSKTQEA